MQRYIALQKVVDTGSFTRAADALGYTQSSVSQMIASLEAELSVTLLVRSRQGARLTLEGEELYPFVQAMVNRYRMTLEKAREISGLETGIVRVGTISSITCHWMPSLIRGFKEIHPNVQFVFHQGDYKLIPEWIRSGEIDFGFISPKAANGLAYEHVKDGEMLAVLPETHDFSDKDTLTYAEIAAEPFILLEEGNYSEPLEAFGERGLDPDIRFRLHDDYAIMTMVEAGLGVSILAKLMVERTNYRIACVPLDPPLKRSLGICYRDQASLPIASKRFIEYLMDHVEELA